MTAQTVLQARLAVIRDATSRQALARWDALPNYDKPLAEEFAAAIAKLTESGELATGRTAVAYLTRQGVPAFKLDTNRVTGAALRNGVDPLELYQRPFGAVWAGLTDGHPLGEAVAMGANRLDMLVRTDLQLAMRATMQAAMDEARGRADGKTITGWQRSADPSACDLCAAADGQVIFDPESMAMHPGCGCTLDPVTGGETSPAADPEAFEVHEHGELGPVLYAAGDHFAAA